MRLRLAAAVAATVAAPLAAPVFAHDFWIEASSFRPAVGSVVQLRLFVGPDFEGEPFPRVPNLLSRFVVVSASSERDVPGRPGMDPAGLIRVESPGLQIVAYRSLNSPLTVDAAKFDEYLKEEGLEKIAELRKKRGEEGKPAREAFSRCAKALLEAGAGTENRESAGQDRPVGLTLELVAEKNPYTLSPGDALPVRLLLENKPLAGALVQALLRGEPGAKSSARTDRSGRVQLRLARPGFWLVKAVEMAPAPRGVDAEWQSLWASLTFENSTGNPVGRAP
jgi:uncharacterized GH25 family protein